MTDIVYQKIQRELERVDEAVDLLESVPAIEPVVSVVPNRSQRPHSADRMHVVKTWEGDSPRVQCRTGAYDGAVGVKQRGATIVLEDPDDRYCDACRGWLIAAVLSNYADRDP